MSAPEEVFEIMLPNDDGWCDWIHPLPGFRLKCCDCGLVHDAEFAIGLPDSDKSALNEGESPDAVVIFRVKRAE